jgi:hypothetical protein
MKTFVPPVLTEIPTGLEQGPPVPAPRPAPGAAGPLPGRAEVFPCAPREPAPRFLSVLLRALSAWPT